MTALPPSLPEQFLGFDHIVNAYAACLRVEDSLNYRDNPKKLINIRILGYLMHYLPKPQGVEVVAKEINSCEDDDALLSTGKKYYDHFIKALKSNRDDLTTTSPSLSSDEFNQEDIDNDRNREASEKDLWGTTSKPNAAVEAKQKACERDGYCCVVTGKCDANALVAGVSASLQDKFSNGSLPTATECTHIFPQYNNSSIEPNLDNQKYTSRIWTIMRSFGYASLPDELNGVKIHRLENVMTMSGEIRVYFNQLYIWFIATEKDNSYRIDARHDAHPSGCPKEVTFTAPDPVRLPLPNPDYLAIHAVCAQVANLSGVAEHIEKTSQGIDITSLNPYFPPAEVLQHALYGLLVSD